MSLSDSLADLKKQVETLSDAIERLEAALEEESGTPTEWTRALRATDQGGTPPSPTAQEGEADWCEGATDATPGVGLAIAATPAAMAVQILNHPNIKLAVAHASGVVDDANARQNIVDTAAGKPARRSSYGNAPGGTVTLDPRMLRGLLTLADSYTFAVSELCGGSHSPTSRQYRGVTADFNFINGKHVSSSHPKQLEFRARCKELGATEVLGPGKAGHSTHVHAAWPLPAGVTNFVRDLPAAGLTPQMPGVGADEAILHALAQHQGLDIPMTRLIDLRNARFPGANLRYWGIVDFDLHSSKKRCFIFDVAARSADAYLAAHGKGSEGPTDDGFANVFSNKSGSNASSLGIYRCGEVYVSNKNGLSLKLDGLESTNSNARQRKIVIHGADYVSEAFIQQFSRVGRSEGCPAVDRQFAEKIIGQLKQGSLLILWKAP